jgi:hypothetical protein
MQLISVTKCVDKPNSKHDTTAISVASFDKSDPKQETEFISVAYFLYEPNPDHDAELI